MPHRRNESSGAGKAPSKLTGSVFAAALGMASFAASMLSAQDIEISSAAERTAARGPESAYTGIGIAEFLFRANESSDGPCPTVRPGTALYKVLDDVAAADRCRRRVLLRYAPKPSFDLEER